MDRKPVIHQLIVVEGKNDAHAIRRALGDVDVLWTEGFGLTSEKLEYIARMAPKQGVIICTDPDYEGERIRQRISKRVPSAQHAYLSKASALSRKGDDIGWENAAPEEIIAAFAKALPEQGSAQPIQAPVNTITMQDLIDAGLAGNLHSSEQRAIIGKILGIGDTNAKQFVFRANRFGLSREDLLKTMNSLKADVYDEN